MNKTYETNVPYRYKVELDTMNDVKQFVAAATQCEGKVILRAGNMTVNAKSLLGVMLARKFSWNELVIEADRDYYGEFRKFIED